MQLLRYLVLKVHRRNRRRIRKRKKNKQVKELRRQFDHVALVRIPNLVMSNLKLHGEPGGVYDKKVTLSGEVAHAAVRAAALNEERLREA